MPVKEINSFLQRVQKNGDFFKEGILKLKKKYSNLIKSIRGEGLLLGIEIRASNEKFCNLAREKKLLLVPAANGVVRLLPPLNVKKNEVKLAISIIEKCLKEMS